MTMASMFEKAKKFNSGSSYQTLFGFATLDVCSMKPRLSSSSFTIGTIRRGCQENMGIDKRMWLFGTSVNSPMQYADERGEKSGLRRTFPATARQR